MANRTRPSPPAPAARRHCPRGPRGPRAFTLAELLIVIGIIALLIGILIPVAARVRISGQTADTSALIRAIDGACQAYYADHRAWPGVFANDDHGLGIAATFNDGTPTPAPIKVEAVGNYAGNGLDLENVTGTENLVLSLMGGLKYSTTAPNAGDLVYDPSTVGRGPVKLGGRAPGSNPSYIDVGEASLSTHAIGDADVTFAGATAADAGLQWGRFVQEGTAARDSLVPEFVDRYGTPLPILYLRAGNTGRITATKVSSDSGNGGTDGRIIVTDDLPNLANRRRGVFNQFHIDGYVGPTGSGTGVLSAGADPDQAYHLNGAPVNTVPGTQPYYHGLQITALALPSDDTAPQALRESMAPGANFTYPYDSRAYLFSPTSLEARQGDRYVLISAGPDRVYGTEDDVTSFGAVRP